LPGIKRKVVHVASYEVRSGPCWKCFMFSGLKRELIP
jgi:hypothetical protein